MQLCDCSFAHTPGRLGFIMPRPSSIHFIMDPIVEHDHRLTNCSARTSQSYSYSNAVLKQAEMTR